MLHTRGNSTVPALKPHGSNTCTVLPATSTDLPFSPLVVSLFWPFCAVLTFLTALHSCLHLYFLMGTPNPPPANVYSLYPSLAIIYCPMKFLRPNTLDDDLCMPCQAPKQLALPNCHYWLSYMNVLELSSFKPPPCPPCLLQFVYLREAFTPSLDDDLGILQKAYGIDGKLHVNYALTPAWG